MEDKRAVNESCEETGRHIVHYLSTENGITNYICEKCGEVIHDYEDSMP